MVNTTDAANEYAGIGPLPVRSAGAALGECVGGRGGHRADADEQPQLALAFWRSVGATRYVRRGEALLAKSA